jgi:hypothetical protein
MHATMNNDPRGLTSSPPQGFIVSQPLIDLSVTAAL